MVPKQVSYRFPGIDYCTVSIQRGKVPIPNDHFSWQNKASRSLVLLGLMCCLSCSTEPRLTTGRPPNQNDATGPNSWCRLSRNSCRLPRFTMSCRFPSLRAESNDVMGKASNVHLLHTFLYIIGQYFNCKNLVNWGIDDNSLLICRIETWDARGPSGRLKN